MPKPLRTKSAVIALARHTLSVPASTEGWVAVSALALFSTVVAFILFLRSLAALGPVRTAIVAGSMSHGLALLH
jgi:drug/metabolite transporter (DMT)-like permease